MTNEEDGFPQTELLLAKIRLQRQVIELSRQRQRIFELKSKIKKMAKVITKKHKRIQQLEEQVNAKNTNIL